MARTELSHQTPHPAAELLSDGNEHRFRHTPPVFLRSKWATALWVAAISLLPMRFANAHLHLCADGQQPPVSIHVQDAPTHFEAADSAAGHDDRDVEVPTAKAVVKVDSADQLALAFIGQYFFALYLPPLTGEPVPTYAANPLLPAPSDLRPPTRGPPR
jgi:hypothetical protein